MQMSGKPIRANRNMRHFTFYRNFYEAVELMEDKQAGQYIKAVYNYTLNNTEPNKLVSPVDLYYTLAKRKLALSKVRSSIGKKGGNTERIPVTNEQVNAIQPHGLTSIGIEGFLKNNPQVKNDIFKSSMHLTEGVDWTTLDEKLLVSKYYDCKSLYQILTHYKEIVGAKCKQTATKRKQRQTKKHEKGSGLRICSLRRQITAASGYCEVGKPTFARLNSKRNFDHRR